MNIIYLVASSNTDISSGNLSKSFLFFSACCKYIFNIVWLFDFDNLLFKEECVISHIILKNQITTKNIFLIYNC